MFCEGCGESIGDRARFCSNCGLPVRGSSASPHSSRRGNSQESSEGDSWVVVLLLVVGLLVAFFFYATGEDPVYPLDSVPILGEAQEAMRLLQDFGGTSDPLYEEALRALENEVALRGLEEAGGLEVLQGLPLSEEEAREIEELLGVEISRGGASSEPVASSSPDPLEGLPFCDGTRFYAEGSGVSCIGDWYWARSETARGQCCTQSQVPTPTPGPTPDFSDLFLEEEIPPEDSGGGGVLGFLSGLIPRRLEPTPTPNHPPPPPIGQQLRWSDKTPRSALEEFVVGSRQTFCYGDVEGNNQGSLLLEEGMVFTFTGVNEIGSNPPVGRRTFLVRYVDPFSGEILERCTVPEFELEEEK